MAVVFWAQSGVTQTALIGTAFASPLVAVVYDDTGGLTPLPGVTVNFTVINPGVTLSAATAVTNALGKASVTATAGSTPQVATVQVSVVGGTPWPGYDVFTLTATDHYVTITQAPVVIDPVRFNMNKQGERYAVGVISTIFGSLHAAFPGPYEYDGRLYYVGRISLAFEGIDYSPPAKLPPWIWDDWWHGLSSEFGNERYAALGQLVVFMSTDHGATWQAQDWANRPIFLNPTNPPRPPNGVTWCWKGKRLEWNMLVLGVQIDIGLTPYAYPTAYNVGGWFDLETNTWMSKSDWNYLDSGWPNFGRGPLSHAAEVLHRLRFSDTTSVLLGADQDNCAELMGGLPNPSVGQGRLLQFPPPGGDPDVTPPAAAGAARFEIDAIMIDTAGMVHLVFFRDTAGVSVRTYWYARVDLGDLSMSAVEDITDRLPIDPAIATLSLGRPAFFGTSLWIPLQQGSTDLGVLRIAGYGAETPEITYEPITPDPAYPAITATLTSIETSEAVIVFWIAGETPGDSSRIYWSYNEGAGWSAATLLCDNSIIVPLEGDTGNKQYLTLGVALLANGDFGIVSATAFNLEGTFTGYASIYLAANITNFKLPGGGGNGGPVPPIPPPLPPWPPSSSGPCRKTTLHLWQPARVAQVEITTDRRSDWTECGDPRNKFFQGFVLDADTLNQPKSLKIRDSDTGALHDIEPLVVQHDGRQEVPYSFETPFLAHHVRDEPLDGVPWRRFGITYVWEPSPESVQTWETQRTAHGLRGYQHICRIEAAYESMAMVTLTLTSFDGVSPAPLSLPSTGGAYRKLLLTLTPNKGQLYQYSARSSQPFRLFLNDWIVWIGEWGRSGSYLPYRNLGGEIGDKASI